MFGEELRRDQPVEAVNKRVIDHGRSAMLLGQFQMIAVEPMPRRKVRVPHHFRPEHFAILERRHHGLVQVRQPQPGLGGHLFEFRGKPADAELIFEQGVNAVQGAARFASGDDQPPTARLEDKTVRPQIGLLEVDVQLRQPRTVADQNLPGMRYPGVGHDRNLDVTDQAQVTLEFAGGIALRGRRRHRDDDAVIAPSPVGQSYPAEQ